MVGLRPTCPAGSLAVGPPGAPRQRGSYGPKPRVRGELRCPAAVGGVRRPVLSPPQHERRVLVVTGSGVGRLTGRGRGLRLRRREPATAPPPRRASPAPRRD